MKCSEKESIIGNRIILQGAQVGFHKLKGIVSQNANRDGITSSEIPISKLYKFHVPFFKVYTPVYLL